MIMLKLRNILLLLTMLFIASCSTVVKKQAVDTAKPSGSPFITLQNTWSEQAIVEFNRGNQLVKDDPQQAINFFEEAIVLEPKMEAAYFNLLLIYYNQHKQGINITDAINRLELKANEEAVLSARILTLLAMVQRNNGQFKSAEQYYLSALEMNEHYSTALVNYAILNDLYLQNLPKAQSYYLKYQQQLILDGQEDKRLKNWLADIKQRIAKLDKENN